MYIQCVLCNIFCNVLVLPSGILNDNDHCNSDKQTFSSRALWCSNRDLSAFNTSTSLDTPDGDEACRLTTVIRSDRSWRATRHSRCSSSNCSNSNISHINCGTVHSRQGFSQTGTRSAGMASLLFSRKGMHYYCSIYFGSVLVPSIPQFFMVPLISIWNYSPHSK